MSPPSFDISDLFCHEEEDYSLYGYERKNEKRSSRTLENYCNNEDLILKFPIQSDECVLEMVKKEIQHLPENGYFRRLSNGDLKQDVALRTEAVLWMLKVITHYNFGPLCAYLSVSYLDRFLSAHESPKGDSWKMQLLAVACLSLAAKMEEINVPLSLELQVAEPKVQFKPKTVRKMELEVLSALRFRMQAITPLSYIDSFLYKIYGENIPPQSAITQSTEIIVITMKKGIEFLEYMPSEIAAAVAVSNCVQAKTVEADTALHILADIVPKDRVLKCIEMIHEVSLRREPDVGLGGNNSPLVTPSAISDKDVTWLRYKSNEFTVNSNSSASLSHIRVGNKRRRLSV